MHFAGQVNSVLTLGIQRTWIHWNEGRGGGPKKCVIPHLPMPGVGGQGWERGRRETGVEGKCAGHEPQIY